MNRILYSALVLAAALLPALAASAEDYPSRTIRMVAPAPPGGSSDLYARLVASKISPMLGRPVIVDNRAGAAGRIGYEHVVKSPADGYTLVLASAAILLQHAMYLSLPYDPVKDFAPISPIVRTQQLMVTPVSLPATDLRSFIALMKSNPNAHNYASSGIGNPPHLAGELLLAMAGIQMVHIPLGGDGPAITELLAGRVSAYLGSVSPLTPLVKSGRLRALAVSGPTRAPSLPDVPTMAEAGLPGYNVSGWFGVLAPAGTPAPIVERLNDAVVKTVAMQDVRERLLESGAEPISASSAEFAQMIASGADSYKETMKRAGIKPQP
jgi:tripartite-type tricarboxylate transporter receptor subunit TctC